MGDSLALSGGIRTRLRDAVRGAYSAAADRPDVKHPFPVGRAFAASLGYPSDLLASVPSGCVDAFAGVSNVAIFADTPQGARVLDLGCGAGLDSLIAARRVGVHGRVIGIDFSDEMLARARKAA
ncbi:MAG: methyltransferase domain-containing protein, partial [Candidatus Rokubacteria bacterium]|nr:methyltransferase domain-containing protein [Candidatus Rokubacteria bacterium]